MADVSAPPRSRLGTELSKHLLGQTERQLLTVELLRVAVDVVRAERRRVMGEVEVGDHAHVTTRSTSDAPASQRPLVLVCAPKSAQAGRFDAVEVRGPAREARVWRDLKPKYLRLVEVSPATHHVPRL